MSGKRKKGSAEAAPRAYGRLTRHERDTVQRMLERRASCREIARELCRWRRGRAAATGAAGTVRSAASAARTYSVFRQEDLSKKSIGN